MPPVCRTRRSTTRGSIELCYELAASERQAFADAGLDEASTDEEVSRSALATLFHEAGHALIAELELPITGREEDVADQLSAYMLTADEESSTYLLTVADTYAMTAAQYDSLEELPFYDTHSLDAQRAVTFLCYAYGAFPDEFEYLVEDDSLPRERAEGCEFEYAQMADAWETSLEPYRKS